MSSNALTRLATQTEKLADDMRGMAYQVVKSTADVVEASIERTIGHDAPHHKVAGGGVGVTQRTLSRGDDARIMVKATGPLHLLANPTNAHLILAKTSTSGKSRRARLASYDGSVGPGARAMRTPYGPRYAVHHPGTAGKNTWHRGVDEARPLIGKTMQAVVAATIGRIFR